MKQFSFRILIFFSVLLCLPFSAKAQQDTLVLQRDTLPIIDFDNALPQYANDSMMHELVVNEDSDRKSVV